MNDKNILITGGGTGGHLYPAVAVIEHLRKNRPEISITFIGPRRGAGKNLISGIGVEFYSVRARGLVNGGNVFTRATGYLLFLAELIPGFLRALSILRKKRICTVLGMGGYICAPVLLAAMARKTPFALHEQNYIPGRLNRLFSGKARYVFTSFRDSEKFLDGKAGNIVYTGNPVRESIKRSGELSPDYKKWDLSEKRFTVTAFGGSLGARRINETVLGLGKVMGKESGIQVLLISGARFYDSIGSTRFNIENDSIPIRVFPYIHRMEEVYRITDLIVARAGANTVFETAAAGIPSILIPYPSAVDDHQRYNARYLEQQGISVMIDENELTPAFLAEKINILLQEDRKIYNRMKKKAWAIPSADSAGIISGKLLEDIIGKR